MENTADILLRALQVALDHRVKHEGIVAGLHFTHHLCSNMETMDKLRCCLDDDESRKLLDWIIYKRILDCFVSREFSDKNCPAKIGPAQWGRYAEQAQLLPERDLIDNLEVDVIENYILDGYNIKEKCEVLPGDIVIDLGAFNGNSTIVMARRAGAAGKVYAFEPNPSNRQSCRANLEKVAVTNYELVPFGASSEASTARFAQGGAGSRLSVDGNIEVDLISVDEFVMERRLDRVDFIKFDIEGHEIPALKGCFDTIRQFRPKLAISVYHLHYDLFEIPKLVREACAWYKMYLRHNATYDGEIVLFCVPIV